MQTEKSHSSAKGANVAMLARAKQRGAQPNGNDMHAMCNHTRISGMAAVKAKSPKHD